MSRAGTARCRARSRQQGGGAHRIHAEEIGHQRARTHRGRAPIHHLPKPWQRRVGRVSRNQRVDQLSLLQSRNECIVRLGKNLIGQREQHAIAAIRIERSEMSAFRTRSIMIRRAASGFKSFKRTRAGSLDASRPSARDRTNGSITGEAIRCQFVVSRLFCDCSGSNAKLSPNALIAEGGADGAPGPTSVSRLMASALPRLCATASPSLA